MSLDNRIREILQSDADFTVSIDNELGRILQKGRRRAAGMRLATVAFAAAVVAGGFVAVHAWRRPAAIAPVTSDGIHIAPREPSDREFRSSYHVAYRWRIASGVTSGKRWDAWAFSQQPGALCMASAASGSCFTGFEPGKAVVFASGGEEPPLGGIVDVSGYVQRSVVAVRIQIRSRDPIVVSVVAVPGFDVRCFVVVLPGRLADIEVISVVGLDVAGNVVN